MKLNKTALEYMNNVVDDRRELFEKLCLFIEEAVPNAEVLIWYRLLTFRIKPGWVALGYRKNGVTLYSEDKAAIEKYKKVNPKSKTGKACINFKPGEAIPLDDLKAVILSAIKAGDRQ